MIAGVGVGGKENHVGLEHMKACGSGSPGRFLRCIRGAAGPDRREWKLELGEVSSGLTSSSPLKRLRAHIPARHTHTSHPTQKQNNPHPHTATHGRVCRGRGRAVATGPRGSRRRRRLAAARAALVPVAEAGPRCGSVGTLTVRAGHI